MTESSAEAISRIASSDTFAYLSVVRADACPIAFAIFWRLTPRDARFDPKVCRRSLNRHRRSIPASTFARENDCGVTEVLCYGTAVIVHPAQAPFNLSSRAKETAGARWLRRQVVV